jgi:ABC-type multidrug transport system fused ATPase/permease subunit
MKQIVKDPVLHFTAGLVSTLKWMCWVLMGLAGLFAILALAISVFDIQSTSQAAQNLNKNDFMQGFIFMAFAALFGFLYGWFFKLLRTIIDNVGAGSPLSFINAGTLLKMAKILGLVLILNLGVDLTEPYWSSGTGENNSSFDLYFNTFMNFLGTLLPVLLLFILARIFHTGATMQNELEGTI